jgi:flagellar biosynthesis chaperone FliJ
LLAFLCSGLTAQTQPNPLGDRLAKLIETREAIKRDIDLIKKKDEEIAAAKNHKDLVTKPSAEEIGALERQLKELQVQLQRHEANLQDTAAGVGGLNDAPKEPEDVDKEVKEVIVRPLLGMAKDLVSRQREISDIRGQLEHLGASKTRHATALVNLTKTLTEAKAAKLPDLVSYLEEQIKAVKDRSASMDVQMANLNARLAELEAEKRPLTSYAGALFREGVMLRVGNLLLALAVFFGIMALFRFFHGLLRRWLKFDQMEARPFWWRLANVIYYALTTLAAASGAFLVLYSTDDWLLMTLAMFVLVGLALAARHTLPKVYEQGKILLNMGSTREGERMIYNGLPWLVSRLNLYCELVNPALSGGTLRIPLRQLISTSSRPFDKGEPWFPTLEGEWVLMPDGNPAKVLQQTPEFVRLVYLGGGQQTFLTTEFLDLNLKNLSHGFRITPIFQLDYRHASLAETEIPRILQRDIEVALQSLAGEGNLRRVVVELSATAASGLDFAVLADFTGAVAPRYLEVSRLIHRVCLAAAIREDWTIPFPQLAVHTAFSGVALHKNP